MGTAVIRVVRWSATSIYRAGIEGEVCFDLTLFLLGSDFVCVCFSPSRHVYCALPPPPPPPPLLSEYRCQGFITSKCGAMNVWVRVRDYSIGAVL